MKGIKLQRTKINHVRKREIFGILKWAEKDENKS